MRLREQGIGRGLLLALATLALAILVGMVALWPEERRVELGPTVVEDPDRAEVVSVSGEGCEEFAGPECRLVEIELRSGPNEGERSSVSLPEEDLAPTVEPGDEITVAQNSPPGVEQDLVDELPIDDPSLQPYAFVDFERKAPLLWLALGFAALVIAFGRRQGLRSLVGLGASLLIVTQFLVPAILGGEPPFAVALFGSLGIMAVTISFTHGISLKSSAAMLGTTASLVLTALLAVLFVELAHITGFASEEATLLQGATGGRLSLEGLVLAGMVIAALGVLDDVTVSQASAVMAIRKADPRQGWRTLYSRAIAVGRDHVAATVNTLVLAYVGAALPVLLIFANQGTSLGEALNREPVATEVVATLVGSIGLISAVPLTTGLAAWLVSRVPADALPANVHAHAH